MRKVLALLLVLALLVGTLPTALAADEMPAENSDVRVAEELPGSTRLEQREISGSGSSFHPKYNDDDLVNVIVQLDEPALLDYYGKSFYNEDRDLSAGEALSAFLTSADAVAATEDLLAQQEQVLNAISSLQSGITAFFHSVSVQAKARWTVALNGMAVSVPYGSLEAIRNLPGVKRAYVEHTYDLPAPEIGTDRDSIYGYSYDMTGLNAAWEEGFTGKGMLVAVIDSGLDIQYDVNQGAVTRVHEAFTDTSFRSQPEDSQLRYTSSSLNILLQTTALNATADGLDAGNLYKNRKVPFAYDYAGVIDPWSGNIVAGDPDVQPTTSDHGTHVAGTIAGYAESSEGAVVFSGIAPDAQILAMKVFPDGNGGAPDSAIFCALEDALKLGADVVNLSLGSDNGFAHDDTPRSEIYAKMENAGIILMTAAGNSATSASSNNYGGYNLSSDPDISMISSPAIYDSNLAVASINNTIITDTVLTWTGSDGTSQTIPFVDPNTIDMKKAFTKDAVEIIPVGGYGSAWDYYEAGFTDWGETKVGIALVRRGELSFTEKVQNAQWLPGVKGVIVYDNDPNGTEMVTMALEDTTIPAAFITGRDGAALLAALEAGKVTMKVEAEDRMSPFADGYQMSSFSSWGTGPSLELKPEITAPGGNIWSTIMDKIGSDESYSGSYGMMSGTSMATPHMTGLAALVEQYVQTKLNVSKKEIAASVTNHLLVSTAIPQLDASGEYYSPRLQGAGLVNVAAAIESPAYISVPGQLIGKLELGDDAAWSGSYPLNFHVNNLTGDTLTYSAKVVVLRPDCQDGAVLDSDVCISEIELGTVTVPAGGVDVSESIQLSADEIAEIRALFPNGTFIEGFVLLEDPESENPQIGIPYLAFLGDWTAAPILDSAKWTDEPEDGENVWANTSTWGTSYVNSAYIVDGVVLGSTTLGQNLFDPASENQGIFHPENIAISPNGDHYADLVNDFTLYQLRNAKLIVAEVTDKATGELYFRDYVTNNFKTTFNPNYSMPVPCSWYYFTERNWDGTDLAGNILPSGTQCVYTITAFNDGTYGGQYDSETGRFVIDYSSIVPGENEPAFNGHSMDSTGDTFTFDVMVDTTAPLLEDNAVRIYEEDGRTYMTGTFYDEGAIASIEVLPLVEVYDAWYGTTSYKLDGGHPFYVEQVYDPAVKTRTFTADVTAYAGESDHTKWTGIAQVYGGDYAANDRGYSVVVDATEGLALSHTSALLYPGESFLLSVNNNTGEDGALTRTSSNPEVATIDEFGNVVAIAPGQTIITISNGQSSAICIVAVEERPSRLESFELSLEHFSGLKPGTDLEVRITDIQPQDVDLDSLDAVYTVEADDPAYSDLLYYETGEDGMSFFITVAPTGMPKEGSSGTLTVTIDGITRTMTFDWEDLYERENDDDIVPDHYEGQVVYVNQGETATLVAKYNNSDSHQFAPVALYTAEGCENSSYDNPTTPATGLILDGAPFCGVGKEWTGKLVNTEGYALPETIRVFQRYDDGYESEWFNEWSVYFEYDSATGEINVPIGPFSPTTTLVIRTDGVEAAGNPAGTLSGTEYDMPDSLYGPFEWILTSGAGTLTPAEGVKIDYSTVNAAYYTPDEPGVSYVTASSKDGAYHLNYAVVSLPVRADTVTLDTGNLRIEAGSTATLTAVLSPEPSLPEDAQLVWTSFNEDVVQVSAGGVLTALTPGFAMVKVQCATDARIYTYCIVEVVPASSQPSVPVTGVKLSKDAVVLTEGESTYLSATVSPADASNQNLTWSSSNPGVVKVDSNGKITAVGAGKAVIRVTTVDGGYTDVCAITVRKAYVPPVTPPIRPVDPYPVEPEETVKPSEPDVWVNPFTDVSVDDWFYSSVAYVAGNDLMTGMTPTSFSPDSITTRAMIWTILARMSGEDVDGGSPWYAKARAWSMAEGISDGTSPDGAITREQLVTMLYRFAGSPAVSASDLIELERFADADTISTYAVDAMAWAVANNIVTGDSAGNLQPGVSATRAEVAAMISRYDRATSYQQ